MEQPETDSEEGLLERLGNALAPEAPVEEAIEASQQEEVADDEQPAEEEQPEDDGLVELELEGETVRVPPKLKEGYLRQSDYTRKTQDLATLQKQATAVIQQGALVQQFQQATQEERQQLEQLKSAITWLKGESTLDKPVEELLKNRALLDQYKDQAAEIEKSLGTKQEQLRRTLVQQRQQAAANAYEYISRHVKDWTPDSSAEQEIARYVGDYGVTPETLAEVAVMFPGFAVMAHKAAQFDKLQATKGQSVQKAQKAPPVVKPGAVTQNNAQQKKASDIRSRLKKSGDWKDAAALFMLKGK